MVRLILMQVALTESWSAVDVDTAANIDNNQIEQIEQVLLQIQQFRFNFSRVVLPEILKAVQSGDESLRVLIKQLSTLRAEIDKVSTPLPPTPRFDLC